MIFINDVCDIFNNLTVSCKLYADDIKLYSCYDTKASMNDLSVATDKLYQWSVTWQLPIAIDKCFLCRIANTHTKGLITVLILIILMVVPYRWSTTFVILVLLLIVV